MPALFERYALWGILALVALVHAPALLHVARADQILYLAETAQIDGLWDLTIGAYAFNRTNSPGDYSLFRPVLYVLLGIERWLFGYRFGLWQAVSLGLHLGVSALLWKYLRAWTTPLASALLCAYFALQYASMEMVIWHHIAGYLLFCALLVAAAHALFAPDEHAWPWLGMALLVVAAFTYELGSIAAVAAVLAMLAGRGLAARRSGNPVRSVHRLPLIAASAAIPFVYFACSAADLYHQFGTLSHLRAARLGMGLAATTADMANAAAIWAGSGFVPTLLTLRSGDRLEYREVEPLSSGDVLAGLLLLAVFLVAATHVLRQRLDREALRARIPALAFLGLTLGGYCAMIVLGRANERGFAFALGNASYYAYPFNLLLVMLAGVLVARPREATSGPRDRWARVAVAVALVSIAVNARAVTRTNLRMAEWSRDRAALIAAADRLQQAHASDPAFTFSVAAPCPANPPQTWFPRESTTPVPTLLGVLFPSTYRERSAAHILPCS